MSPGWPQGRRVGDGVRGVEVQPGGDVAKLQVQVHNHHAHRGNLAQSDGDVGGDGGFAHSSLGGEDTDDEAAAALRRRGGLCPVAAGELLGCPLQQHTDFGGLRVRAQNVPDAGAHGMQDEIGVRLADQDDAQLRKLDIQDGCQSKGLVHGHPGAQDKNLRLLDQLCKEVVWIGGQHAREERLYAALQAAGNGLA
ncbi:hypothetical protein AHiyo6_12200 [Arthrobacter sp. Hiyo6]|nr:hypothetical protein AHiyo6_12200 [Arthrobacter sp. Hiyo6]